jgi:hypothetical protein
VEHSPVLPVVDGDVRPWRRATILMSVVAAFELVALCGAGFVLVAKPLARHMQAAAEAQAFAPARAQARRLMAAEAPAGKAKLTRSETSVLVLNGSNRGGLASATAEALHRKGYLIGGVANAPHGGQPRTVVMYRPGYRAEGIRLAHDLGIRIVGPLDGMRPAQLGGAHAVVLLGAR